jgi:hypothetical protein
MDRERKRDWTAYCHRMAEMAYAMADQCQDPEVMNVYIGLGARWILHGQHCPPAPRRVWSPQVV